MIGRSCFNIMAFGAGLLMLSACTWQSGAETSAYNNASFSNNFTAQNSFNQSLNTQTSCGGVQTPTFKSRYRTVWQSQSQSCGQWVRPVYQVRQVPVIQTVQAETKPAPPAPVAAPAPCPSGHYENSFGQCVASVTQAPPPREVYEPPKSYPAPDISVPDYTIRRK